MSTTTTVSITDIATKLKMSPKVARRKLRDAFGDMPKPMQDHVNKNGWVFTKAHVARVVAILKA